MCIIYIFIFKINIKVSQQTDMYKYQYLFSNAYNMAFPMRISLVQKGSFHMSEF